MSSSAWSAQGLVALAKNPPKSATKKYENGDHAGFCIGITPSGSLTPYLQYPWKGKRPFYRLGDAIKPMSISADQRKAVVGEWLTDARKAAGSVLATIAKGDDPMAVREAKKAAESAVDGIGTAEQLFACYFDAYAEGRLKKDGRPGKKLKELLWRYERDILPVVGGLKANQITDSHVMAVVSRPINRCKGTARSGSESASDLWVMMSAALGYGLKFDNNVREQSAFNGLRFEIMFNPAARVPNPKLSRARDFSLNEHQIRLLWNAPYIDRRIECYVKIALLTGQRINEIAGMSWAEIDGNLWTIPRMRTKTYTDHTVYLCDTALELLESMKELYDSPYVFPVQAPGGERGMDDRLVNASLMTVVKALGVEKFTSKTERFQVKDIRRTWKTHLGRLKVSLDTRNTIQNHAKGDVGSKHYDRYSYLDEKTEAMLLWEKDLLRIVNALPSDKVRAIR